MTHAEIVDACTAPEQWTGAGRYVYTADDGAKVDLGILARPVDLEASLEALGAWTGTVDRCDAQV